MFSYVGGTNDYPKFIVAALFGVLLYKIFLKRCRFELPLEYQLAAAWFLLCTVSAFAALDSELVVAKLLTLVTVIPMSLVLMHFVVWYRSPKSIWAGIVIGALIMCYLSASSEPVQPADERLTGTAGNANELGYVLIVTEVILLYAMFVARTIGLKVASAALAAVIVYFIPLTGSKQAMILLFVVAVVYMILKTEWKNATTIMRSLLVVGVIAGALAASLTYFHRTTYFDRFVDFSDSAISGKLGESGRTGESTKNRYLFYVNGLDMALRNPALGVGLDNFRVAITDYPGFREVGGGSYAHSNYIEVLADTGFPGFVLYFSIYVVLGRRLIGLRKQNMNTRDRQLYHALIALFCVILVSDIAMVSYYDKIAWIVMASVIGGALLLQRRPSDRAAGYEKN
jgi:O-antigen ligase